MGPPSHPESPSKVKPEPATGPQVSSPPPIRKVRPPPRPTPAARDPPPTTALMTRKPLVTKPDAKHAPRRLPRRVSPKPASTPVVLLPIPHAKKLVNAALTNVHQTNAHEHD